MHNTLDGLVDFPVDHSERKGKGREEKMRMEGRDSSWGKRDDVEQNLDTVGRFDEAGKRISLSLFLSRRVK